jgi:hypothetical protein
MDLIDSFRALFTRALTLATSTVRVSIINTTANFLLTALLGLLIFRESLPREDPSKSQCGSKRIADVVCIQRCGGLGRASSSWGL